MLADLRFSLKYVRLGIFALLAITAIVRPWHYDEGWVFITSLGWLKTGAFRYVIYMNDAQYTFVKPWFWATLKLHQASFPGMEFIICRTPSLILTFLGWLLIERTLRLLGYARKLHFICAFAIYYIWALEILISCRPDSAYAFVVILVFAVFIQKIMAADDRIRGLDWALIAVGPIAACHPVGIFSFGLWALGICVIWRQVKSALFLTFMGVLSFGLFIRAGLWDLTVPEFIEAYKVVSTSNTHSHGIWQEWQRYFHMSTHFPYLNCTFLVSLVGFVTFMTRCRQSNLRAFFGLGALGGMVFLALYPAKWTYYFAILLPWMILAYVDFMMHLLLLIRPFVESLVQKARWNEVSVPRL